MLAGIIAVSFLLASATQLGKLERTSAILNLEHWKCLQRCGTVRRQEPESGSSSRLVMQLPEV